MGSTAQSRRTGWFGEHTTLTGDRFGSGEGTAEQEDRCRTVVVGVRGRDPVQGRPPSQRADLRWEQHTALVTA